MILALAPSSAPTDPTSPPHAPGLDIGQLLGDFVHGLWMGVTSSPWTAVGFAAFLVLACVGTVHGILYPSSVRDPVRRFGRGDKAVVLTRAGGRCEHHSLLFGRCKATDRLEADHVHPHSRGGWTAVANGQALCHAHNRHKRASIPYNWQLRALAKRRGSYFPPRESTAVVRRRPSTRVRRRSAAREQ